VTRFARPPRQLVLHPLTLVLAFVVSAAAGRIGVPIGFCAMRAITGLPCPGCGITASLAALLRGDVRRAIEANVAGPFVAAFFLAQIGLLLTAFYRAAPEESVLRAVRLGNQWLLAVLLVGWISRIAAMTN
jgi:hypothetical protein